MNLEITNLQQLEDLLHSVPDGTTANVLSEDLEAGNFDTAILESAGGTLEITYTGPVREGYVGPFEDR